MTTSTGAYVMRLAHTDGMVGKVAHVIVTPSGKPPGPGVGWRTACGFAWADGVRTGPRGWRFFARTTELVCRRCDAASGGSAADCTR